MTVMLTIAWLSAVVVKITPSIRGAGARRLDRIRNRFNLRRVQRLSPFVRTGFVTIPTNVRRRRVHPCGQAGNTQTACSLAMLIQHGNSSRPERSALETPIRHAAHDPLRQTSVGFREGRAIPRRSRRSRDPDLPDALQGSSDIHCRSDLFAASGRATGERHRIGGRHLKSCRAGTPQ